jgi:glycosyltransferase involved in cell wall biosynthesis
LSWSLLEALSAGCMVVGSNTAPVREAVHDGRNGRLVDFFDQQALIKAVVDALANPAKYRAMRKAARESVLERYDLKTACLPKQIELLEAGATPQPAAISAAGRSRRRAPAPRSSPP